MYVSKVIFKGPDWIHPTLKMAQWRDVANPFCELVDSQQKHCLNDHQLLKIDYTPCR